jgi:flagellar hook-associated protein 1 FlgK
MSIFGIGVSALTAAQAALTTSGHNIANANTPGFNRQEAQLATNPPFGTGAGYFGQGVRVDTVRRSYDQFLHAQVLRADAGRAELDTYLTEIKQLDNMVADADAGLSPALQEFFRAVQDVSANPSAAASRQAMLAAANSLTSRFHALNLRMSDMAKGVNDAIEAGVTVINAYAARIAELNESIVTGQAGGAGHAINDLLDQRDQLVSQLNVELRASVVVDPTGNYNVYFGNGQPLVVGGRAAVLLTQPDALDPSKLAVAYATSGNAVTLSNNSLQGGRIGGAMRFRSEALEPTRNALGRLAVVLADTFNTQHHLGQDLNGLLGGDFFRSGALSVLNHSANSGTASIALAIGNAGQLTSSDYRLDFDGSNYTVTRLADNTSQTFASLPQTIDGLSISIASGSAAAGDRYLLQPLRYGAQDIELALSDVSLIAAATPIRTRASLTNSGTGAVSAGRVTSTTNLPLPGPITLTYSAATGQLSVTGAVPAVAAFAYSNGADIAFNGIEFSISGILADGDSFSVEANTGGIADNRNALALAQLQLTPTVGNGSATYQSAYSQMVSAIGNRTRELDINYSAQQALVAQAVQAREEVSGVNLDEEAANLLRFQQAYQAAGKLVEVANKVFETILSL